MDLSPPALYLYLLVVVTLYSLPFVLVGFFVARSKGYLAQFTKATLIGIPALAGLAQLSFYLDLSAFSMRLQSDRDYYNETFPAEVSVYPGRIIDRETLGGYTYTRYQFDVDPLLPDVVEIKMPPHNVTSAAIVRVTRAKPALSGTGPIQLVIRNTGSYTNPGHETPKSYFHTHYPEIAAYITEGPLLILTLQPGDNSSVSAFIGLEEKRAWDSQMAVVDL